MEQQVAGRRMRAHGGWRPDEVERLWAQVHWANDKGEPLRAVFERVGAELSRKPNSIRNFYYAQLKERQEPALKRALPFATFTEDEVRGLLRQVLSQRAQGLSVRACVQRMADGDRALMLRFQNKYRSTLKARPQLVRQVMQDMEAAGEPYVDPLTIGRRQGRDPQPLYQEAVDTIQRIGDPALAQMLDGMNQLLQLALARTQRDRTQELDRLSVRHDLTRIALDDAQRELEALRQGCQGLVQDIKEFLALSEFARAQRMGAFCQALSERLAALEQALPFAQSAPQDEPPLLSESSSI
ncbi:MAG: hypothetical protein LBU67_06120 [Oscillospiraceae bacterium]|jgi:hypothetical protein|nr:hypothetical protein [Oscillospiraceae bacterium]